MVTCIPSPISFRSRKAPSQRTPLKTRISSSASTSAWSAKPKPPTARAALVWHTNGRSSLRFAGSGGSEEGGNATENIIGGNLSSEEDLKELFGQHLTEHNLNKGYTFTKYGPDLTALSVQGFQPSMPNHFLLKTTRKTSTDYWFAGITDKTIPIDSFQKEHGVMIQISTMIHPPGSSKKPHFFGGLLFRTHMLQGKSALTPHGVSGLGMGIVYGSIEIENSEKEGYYEVDDCTINPALLPGFEWFSKDSNDPEEPDGSFRIAVSLYRGFHLPDAK